MKEFLELVDVDSFMKLADKASVVIRLDPYVFINLYGLTFYINLSKLDRRDVRRVIYGLKDKLIMVRKSTVTKSIKEFLEEQLSEREDS